jgi:8-oxo-dGTP pyrophosphatase MutT (NUDIX family)
MSFGLNIILTLLLLFIIQIYLYNNIILSCRSSPLGNSTSIMDDQTFLQLIQKQGRHADNMIYNQLPPQQAANTSMTPQHQTRPPSPRPSPQRAPGNSSNNTPRNIRTEFRGFNYALIICQHPVTKKFLAVHETKNRGWWIPGGGVMAGETFREAAIREAWEEAGVEIQLKGVLRIEHNVLVGTSTRHHDPEYVESSSLFKMRVIFYAEPRKVHDCEPKSVPDDESLGAEWVTTAEFQQKQNIRGHALLKFAALVEQGKIYPLDVLDEGI